MISLHDKTVLVTGANGFIGKHLCKRLLSEGATIHGVSRKKQDNQNSVIRWWRGDLSELTFTQDLIKQIQPHIIFHMSSYVVGHRELAAVQPTFHANLHGAVNLLTAASEAGCMRIVLAGSQEEPDSKQSSLAVPSSPYAAAKWASSAYARMFHALYDTPVTLARIFMVYGPGQNDTKKLIPYTILSLLNDEMPKLTSGDRPIDWIYVDDVAKGLIAIAQSELLNGSTVDLGSGAQMTVREIVEKLDALIDSKIHPQFGAVATRKMEQIRVAKRKQTRELTGWKAETSIDEGLKSTIQWYRDHM